MAQMRIFVGHSHEDDAFCRALVAGLRRAGADVWYDEHNLGSGQLMTVIQRELGSRPVFVVILTRATFASRWVRRETLWAYELGDRDPTRILLPVTAGPIGRSDFSAENEWLFLHDFKRIEAPGYQPYPQAEAVTRTLHALQLTLPGEAPLSTGPLPADSVADLIGRGRALNAQGKYAEALPLFQRARARPARLRPRCAVARLARMDAKPSRPPRTGRCGCGTWDVGMKSCAGSQMPRSTVVLSAPMGDTLWQATVSERSISWR